MKTITLTDLEWSVLYVHFRTDIRYGVNGTFGDGDEYVDMYNDRNNKEYAIGKRILKKIEGAK